MKKIAVFSLLSINNHGEQFIADCVKYLAQQENDVDITVNQLEAPLHLGNILIYGFLMKVSDICPGSKFSVMCQLWGIKTRNANYYQKKLADIDAIIIGAGSYKYGTQKLWADYSVLIETAACRNIPVMFNAMNVQKYDPNNRKCLTLAEHTNYPNVRTITTRDMDEGIRKLRNDYHIRENIRCAAAGDPAFWIPECYGVSAKKNREIIGVNVIIGENFRKYGGILSENAVIDIYCGLLKKLDEMHLRWELFTNGIPADLEFGKRILKQYGNSELPVVVPTSAKNAAELIASYRVILGARLHACICAYALNIPLAGLLWDEKLVYFAHMAKIDELFFKESELDPSVLADKLADLYHHGYTYDIANRDYWKEQTRIHIHEFINSL